MPSNAVSEAVVREWVEAFGRRDVGAALKLMSDGCLRTGDWGDWTTIENTAWTAGQECFFVGFPDWTWELTNLIVAGEWVVCELVEHGTWTLPFEILPGHELTPPSTGTSYVDHDCVILRVNDEGLIVEIRSYLTKNLENAFHFEAIMMDLLKASA